MSCSDYHLPYLILSAGNQSTEKFFNYSMSYSLAIIHMLWMIVDSWQQSAAQLLLTDNSTYEFDIGR